MSKIISVSYYRLEGIDLNSVLGTNLNIDDLRYHYSNYLIRPFFRLLLAKNEYNGKPSLVSHIISHSLLIFPSLVC